VTPRDLTLAALNSFDREQGFPERYLKRAFKNDTNLSDLDKAFAVHLVQGVLRWRLRIDWVIEQFLRFPFNKIEPSVLNILRIAIFQILYMDRVPESAAVNEAVKQTKVLGDKHIPGFVNGILRTICRKRAQVVFPNRDKDEIRYLSIFYSYPEWLIKKWVSEMGVRSAERLFEAENRIPALVLRTNTLQTTRTELIFNLAQKDMVAEPTKYSPDGLRVDTFRGSVDGLSAYREGQIQVQGEAAQICAYLLSPKKGEWGLDLCAGLGGKTTHLAQLVENEGTIVALDKSCHKLGLLQESARRLGTRPCIHPIVGDAAFPLRRLFREKFHWIVLDGPCSGLGTLSRHPDIKWRLTGEDIQRLADLQKNMLHSLSSLLRKGGRVLYATCTISKEENEDVVRAFLNDHRNMALLNLKEHIPDWGTELVDDDGFYRTAAQACHMDGFFGALFVKKD